MKVYVVTRGSYSDFSIEKVFLDLNEAEKYCAVHNDDYLDTPIIETYDTDDNEKIVCDKVYKAFLFNVNNDGSIYVSARNVVYSLNPIKKEINHSKLYAIETYFGQIPYEGDFDTKKFKKIVSDEVSKLKAEEAGL